MEHIPKIIIKTIKPENHRYQTCGDYIYDREDDTLTVFVSKMDDWRSELAVAIHEVFESVLCLHEEIDFVEIDRFDVQYELARDSGQVSEFSEPGDSKTAPYHCQHVGATFVEHEVCSRLDLPWGVHEKTVNDA